VSDESSRALPERCSSTGPRVLLIGDSAETEAARTILAGAGYATRLERDGCAALSALDDAPYDLVVAGSPLIDCDGVGLLRAIRNRPGHADLYVIALTTPPGPAPVQVLAGGADDYLEVPFDEVHLLARARAGVRNAQLHTSEARLRTLIANVPGAIYRCANDEDWTMELISDDIERISGYPPADFINSAVRSFASIIHPDDRDQVAKSVAEAIQQGHQFALEYRITRADGSLAYVLERGQQVNDSTGRSWLDGVIFDITEWRLAEDRLHDSKRRLAIAEDRERIARELHDGIIQHLFGLGMQLQAASALADRPDAIRGSLAASVTCLDTVIEDVRNYVFGLRPMLLADRELPDALQRLTTSLQDRSQLVVVLDIDPALASRLAPHAVDIVQLTREALSNVHRHAQATTCRVSLQPSDGLAILRIDDDGRGFDPTTYIGNGQGLRNIAERSAALGARLDIHSGATGTTLNVHLPL
jgi:PAS domain S-box-containing protein